MAKFDIIPNEVYTKEKSLLTSLFAPKSSFIGYLAISMPDALLLFSISGCLIASFMRKDSLKALTNIYS